ncbi:MAG: hypothetical protein EHM45_22240 [Desulfobacteraceae bacterium]|nr:MAG: hypothetical protein EHM45_22240 [Desulfobacteraceae bacterium]
MPKPISVYLPRKPQNPQYYQCVEDHFENLQRVYDDCFARVRCGDCGHEFLGETAKQKKFAEFRSYGLAGCGFVET